MNYTGADRGPALNRVRNMIGERDYWAGHMPTVPVWEGQK